MKYVKHIQRDTRHLILFPGATLCGLSVANRSYTSPGPIREDTVIDCGKCLKKHDSEVAHKILSNALLKEDG